MAVWGGLTNSCERREVKSKGEKERYKYLNAEFQRIARRHKKAFLSDQCTEIGKKKKERKRNAKKQNGCLGGLTNSCEKKRSEKQRRKGKI